MQSLINLCDKEVKNRYLRSSTAMGSVDSRGYPTEDYYRLYKRIALGKPGIIMNEITCISQDGGHPNFVYLDNDELIAYHKRLTEMVHEVSNNETLIGSQIVHSGYIHDINWYKEQDFDQIVEDFVQAAIRSVKAGYDFIEIHSAHQFLLEQSISDYYNRRTDSYNAKDFLLLKRVFKEIKQTVSIPVGVKINCNDYIYGHTMNVQQLSVILKELPFDFVELSGGSSAGKHITIRKNANDKFYYKPELQQLKKLLGDQFNKIFFIVTGGFTGNGPEEQEALDMGASMIGYSRMFIRQPDFVSQPPEKRLKCGRCNGCLTRMGKGELCICVFDKEWKKTDIEDQCQNDNNNK